MKTTKIFGHWSLVIGIAMLLLAGTAWAVDYKNSYRGIPSQPVYGIATTATVPTTTFQSTSAYSGQWNQDAQQSMLNADGSIANDPTTANRIGPRKAPNGPGTPGGDLDPNAQQPLGDGLWVMILCALAYLIVRASRKAYIKK